jgi:hypothetical protein
MSTRFPSLRSGYGTTIAIWAHNDVAGARERCEGFSSSARDILPQRPVLTKNTHERDSATCTYHLWLEFLTNLFFDALLA